MKVDGADKKKRKMRTIKQMRKTMKIMMMKKIAVKMMRTTKMRMMRMKRMVSILMKTMRMPKEIPTNRMVMQMRAKTNRRRHLRINNKKQRVQLQRKHRQSPS